MLHAGTYAEFFLLVLVFPKKAGFYDVPRLVVRSTVCVAHCGKLRDRCISTYTKQDIRLDDCSAIDKWLGRNSHNLWVECTSGFPHAFPVFRAILSVFHDPRTRTYSGWHPHWKCSLVGSNYVTDRKWWDQTTSRTGNGTWFMVHGTTRLVRNHRL